MLAVTRLPGSAAALCLLLLVSMAWRSGPALASTEEGASSIESPALSGSASDDIVGLIVAAMGGPQAGRAALEAAGGWAFEFSQRVRRQADGTWVLASHHYRRAADGRLRLDVRILEGEGKDSITIVSGEEAWVRTEDGLESVPAEAARQRLKEFSPNHLFDIPLGLPVAPEEFLQGETLEVRSGEATEEGRPVLSVRGQVDQEGEVVMEVDAENYRLLRVSFDSRAGRISYHYGDYPADAVALVLPRHRKLLRNDTLLSVVQVERLELGWQHTEDLFDPETARIESAEVTE